MMVSLWTYAGESGTTLSIFPLLSCTHKALLRYIYACLKLLIDVFLPGPVQFYLADLFNLERVISRSFDITRYELNNKWFNWAGA